MYRKHIFIWLFIAISLNTFAQIAERDFFALEREMRGVRKITETFRRGHSGQWKTVFSYDENGFLLRQVNYVRRQRRGNFEIRADFRFEYFISDTLIKIKEKEIRNINNNPKVHTIMKFYYSSLGQSYRVEIYRSNHSSKRLSIMGDNFIYKDGLLQSFDRHIFRLRPDGVENNSSNRHVFTYDNNLRIERVYRDIHTDTAFWDGCINTSIYQNGRRTDFISECEGGGTLLGVHFWSREKPYKMQIRYTNFDKHGNWTRSYFIMERGKVLRSQRRIEYW